MRQERTQTKLAVLIDADNSQPRIIMELLAEISKYGVASVKRIYGDWTTPLLGGWKDMLLEFAIQPVQQFSYTKGKNSTDSALIIDAMDLLYTEKLDGFCIVSSDSDFTRLASRIREAGLVVYGFGERKTPQSFVGACDRFVFTEIFSSQTKKSTDELKGDTKLVNVLRSAVENSADEDGWAHLGAVGNNIVNQTPEFDARNYGYEKLGKLVEATQLFNIDKRGAEDSLVKDIYVQDIRKSK